MSAPDGGLDLHALRAYEGFAPYYDAFTADHDYEAWTRDIEALAKRAGLRGRRLLDVACGSGKSFLPFLARGYEVTACDLSPAMVELAAAKSRCRARVAVHDMRRLPRLGAFDLVLCLDDALNYLDGPAELRAAIGGMSRNLRPSGVLAFDLNTVRTYRQAFSSLTVTPSEDLVIVWRGQGPADLEPGGHAVATTQVLRRAGDGWEETTQHHRQRHHPEHEVRAALEAAGLRLADLRGMDPDGSIRDPDELRCSKTVYVAVAGQDQRPGTGTRCT